MTRSARLWISWGLMAAVLLGALVIGTLCDPGPRTSQERVYAIADTVKCPQCVGQTVAESDIQISREIRAEITRQVDAGRTDDEIRTQLASSYGEEILLTPSSSGVTGLVWILPVVAAVAAFAGLAIVFRRWRTAGGGVATDDDRDLVQAALGRHHGASGIDDSTAAAGAAGADRTDGTDEPETETESA